MIDESEQLRADIKKERAIRAAYEREHAYLCDRLKAVQYGGVITDSKRRLAEAIEKANGA